MKTGNKPNLVAHNRGGAHLVSRRLQVLRQFAILIQRGSLGSLDDAHLLQTAPRSPRKPEDKPQHIERHGTEHQPSK